VAQDATHRDYFRSTVELIRQAATALEHAHQCGVIHRDVKPGNLLVDQHRHVWVTDFGLAQIQSDVTLTRTGDVLGTLRYMSPEQAAGDRVVLDHRTDIYSLGVTLYELLTLEPLFHAGNRHALIRQVLEDDPRPPRAINPDIPVELETIVLKAIAKSPGDRYPSAQAMADDLQRWLDDKPIAARRPSLRERAARWSRRHRAAVRAAGVVAALAVLGLIVSTVIIARKHLEISAAHAREIEQRKAAEESFRNARQAVDTFTQLAEDGLADVPSLQLLRRQFLEASLEYYGNFLDQRQDDPALRAELAATAEHVKHLIDELSAVEGYASLALLEDANVLADLDTTATQREQLGRIVSQLSDDRKKLRNSAAALSSDERQRQMAETIHAYELQTNAILSPQQTKRLKELRWQQQAPFVFRHPDVVALLGLTTEQKKKVAQVMDEEMDARAPPHRPGQDHPTGEGRRPGEDLADWGPPETRGRRGEKGGSFFDDRPPPREGMSPRDGPPGREGPPGRDDRPPRQGPFGPDSGPGREGGPGRDGFGGPPPHPFGRADDGRPLAPPGKNAGPPDRHGPGGPGGHNGPGGRSGMCDALKRTTARILELLTPEQRAKWDALIGKPATYDLMREPEGWAPR
jgi:hypothetical protein